MCKENCCAKTPNMLAVVKHALQQRFRDSVIKCEPIVLSSVSEMPSDLFNGSERASFYFGNFIFDLADGFKFHLEYNGSPFVVEAERYIASDLLVDSIYSYEDDSVNTAVPFIFYGWRLWLDGSHPYIAPPVSLTEFYVSDNTGDACTVFAETDFGTKLYHDGESPYPIVGDTVYSDSLGETPLVTTVGNDYKMADGDYLRTDVNGYRIEINCK